MSAWTISTAPSYPDNRIAKWSLPLMRRIRRRLLDSDKLEVLEEVVSVIFPVVEYHGIGYRWHGLGRRGDRAAAIAAMQELVSPLQSGATLDSVACAPLEQLGRRKLADRAALAAQCARAVQCTMRALDDLSAATQRRLSGSAVFQRPTSSPDLQRAVLEAILSLTALAAACFCTIHSGSTPPPSGVGVGGEAGRGAAPPGDDEALFDALTVEPDIAARLPATAATAATPKKPSAPSTAPLLHLLWALGRSEALLSRPAARPAFERRAGRSPLQRIMPQLLRTPPRAAGGADEAGVGGDKSGGGEGGDAAAADAAGVAGVEAGRRPGSDGSGETQDPSTVAAPPSPASVEPHTRPSSTPPVLRSPPGCTARGSARTVVHAPRHRAGALLAPPAMRLELARGRGCGGDSSRDPRSPQEPLQSQRRALLVGSAEGPDAPTSAPRDHPQPEPLPPRDLLERHLHPLLALVAHLAARVAFGSFVALARPPSGAPRRPRAPESAAVATARRYATMLELGRQQLRSVARRAAGAPLGERASAADGNDAWDACGGDDHCAADRHDDGGSIVLRVRLRRLLRKYFASSGPAEERQWARANGPSALIAAFARPRPSGTRAEPDLLGRGHGGDVGVRGGPGLGYGGGVNGRDLVQSPPAPALSKAPVDRRSDRAAEPRPGRLSQSHLGVVGELLAASRRAANSGLFAIYAAKAMGQGSSGEGGVQMTQQADSAREEQLSGTAGTAGTGRAGAGAGARKGVGDMAEDAADVALAPPCAADDDGAAGGDDGDGPVAAAVVPPRPVEGDNDVSAVAPPVGAARAGSEGAASGTSSNVDAMRGGGRRAVGRHTSPDDAIVAEVADAADAAPPLLASRSPPTLGRRHLPSPPPLPGARPVSARQRPAPRLWDGADVAAGRIQRLLLHMLLAARLCGPDLFDLALRAYWNAGMVQSVALPALSNVRHRSRLHDRDPKRPFTLPGPSSAALAMAGRPTVSPIARVRNEFESSFTDPSASTSDDEWDDVDDSDEEAVEDAATGTGGAWAGGAAVAPRATAPDAGDAPASAAAAPSDAPASPNSSFQRRRPSWQALPDQAATSAAAEGRRVDEAASPADDVVNVAGSGPARSPAAHSPSLGPRARARAARVQRLERRSSSKHEGDLALLHRVRVAGLVAVAHATWLLFEHSDPRHWHRRRASLLHRTLRTAIHEAHLCPPLQYYLLRLMQLHMGFAPRPLPASLMPIVGAIVRHVPNPRGVDWLAPPPNPADGEDGAGTPPRSGSWRRRKDAAFEAEETPPAVEKDAWVDTGLGAGQGGGSDEEVEGEGGAGALLESLWS